MSGSYTIGGVSGLLSSKIKKKKKSELDTLFSSVSPYRPVLTASIPITADEVKITTPPKPAKKKKRKSEPSPLPSEKEAVSPKKKKTMTEAKVVNGKERVKKGKDEKRVSGGFCPPPGIVHESLMGDTKKNKKTRVEEREEALAGSTTSSKKKKRKRGQEEDDEEEDQEAAPKKKIKIKWEKDPTVDAKTIFVGNLPVTYDTKAVRRLFRKYGKIQSVRLRSATPANLTLPKKVAVIKQEFHPDRKSINAYVVFSEEEETKKALKKNGRLIDGHHIKVDLVGQECEHDHKKSIFVGNLPFAILDDELWECFEEIGNIKSVRVVRDSKTGMGKGFGYVHFKDTTSVALALKLNGKKFKERNIRVTRSRAENRLQKEISLTSEKRPKKKKKFSKPSNAAAGSFQGQKALTDDEIKKLRKKKKMARSGVHGKGKKANVLNAMLRLKKRQGGGAKGDAMSATPPKGGKKDKNGLGSGKKNKIRLGNGKKNKTGFGSGKRNKMLPGSGKKNKTGLGTTGKGIKKGLGIGKKKKMKHGKK
ncbi:RNA-binding protein 34-like [Lineus longissimus]|uniref:RNA-binding protein 34-like n=1 Tax=Lineus longissimus TaxID=88925 RepID=UPI00315CB43A